MAEDINNTNTTGAGTDDNQAAAGNGEAVAASASEGEQSNGLIQKLMQKFLGGDQAGGDGAQQEEPPAGTEGEQQQAAADGKTYTDQDVQDLIAAERQKWQEEQQRQVELANLSPEERAKVEQQNKDQQISALQAQLQQRDLKDAALAALTKDGFPVGLADLLDYSGKDQMEKSLASVKSAFEATLAEAVQERLKGKTPPGIGNPQSAENKLKAQIAQNIRGGN